MSTTKSNDESLHLQNKVFTRWVNEKLKNINKNIKIDDITKDLSNGTVIFQLAQTLTKKNSSESNSNEIKLTEDVNQNYQTSIDMFTKDGVELSEFSLKDICENYDKMILKFIWELISHYSIKKSLTSTDINKDNNKNQFDEDKFNINHKEALFSWANNRISTYPYVKKFKPYVLAICALLDSYVPDKINYYSLDPNDSEHNLQLAFDVMNYLGIPIYIYQEEILQKGNELDEKAVLTQLASFKIVLDIQQSMTESFSVSKSENESKGDSKFEYSSSNVSTEFDYDNYSSSESQDKLYSNEAVMNQTISNVLFETQRITQKQIEKLMGKIENLTEQIYEYRGKIGEFTQQAKKDKKTISDLMQQLSNSQTQSTSEVQNINNFDIGQLKLQLSDSENKNKNLEKKLEEVEKRSQEIIAQLKQKIMESENISRELELKLAETEKNYKKTIQNLQQHSFEINEKNRSQISSFTSELAQLKQQFADSQEQNKDLESRLSEIQNEAQKTTNQLTKQLTDSEEQKKELANKLVIKHNEDKETINQLKQQIADFQKKNKDLENKLAEGHRKSQETIDQLKQQISDAEKHSKELEIKLSENESKIHNRLTLVLSVHADTISNPSNESNQYDEIVRLTKENERINKELSSSISNEASLAKKLNDAESNYNILMKELSETRVSMRKSLFDSEMKSHVFSLKAQKEIDDLTIENRDLKEELSKSQTNEDKLTNVIAEMKKKSEIEINHLMIALSDAENRCIDFYHKNQSEIKSLKIQLADSQDQVKLQKYEFDQLKQAFTDSQAQVCKYYQQLCDLQSQNDLE